MQKLSNAVINEIATETDVNNHLGALWVLALELTCRYGECLVEELERIAEEHEKAGYLTDTLNSDRALARRVIMQQAANTYSNFDDIRAAF